MHKSATKIYSTQQTIYFIGGVHKSGTNLIKDILNQLPQVSVLFPPPRCSVLADIILGAGNPNFGFDIFGTSNQNFLMLYAEHNKNRAERAFGAERIVQK